MRKVSIIIPCYNQGQYVAEAIESALAQTYKNIEIIVVNDASTDNSADVINEYAKSNKKILFFNEEVNKGVIFARNLAISAATGDYILPLDADDIIAKEYVEKAVKILDEKPEVKIVYCRSMLFGNKQKEFKLDDFSLDTIIFHNCIPNTGMYRRCDFIAAGGYKKYMNNGWEDWDLWLSIIEKAEDKDNCVERINEILFFYRQYEKNTRSNFGEKERFILRTNLIKNHLELFTTNSAFLKRVFEISPKKFNKYHNLYQKFMYSTIFCLFFIFVLMLGYLR